MGRHPGAAIADNLSRQVSRLCIFWGPSDEAVWLGGSAMAAQKRLGLSAAVPHRLWTSQSFPPARQRHEVSGADRLGRQTSGISSLNPGLLLWIVRVSS